MYKERGNYFTGLAGAILGGLIGAIPMIFSYVVLSLMSSVLALLVSLGSFYGYRLFKGKQDKIAIVLVVVTTLIIITIATFVFIPAIYLAQEGYPVNGTYLKWYFSSSDIIVGYFKDYVISLVLAFIGIKSGIHKMKAEMSLNQNEEIIESSNEETKEVLEENKQTQDISKFETSLTKSKRIFSKYQALDKHHAIEKEVFMNECNIDYKEEVFKGLVKQKLIRKYKGKFYFDERVENNPSYRLLLNTLNIIKWFLIIVIGLFLLLFIIAFIEVLMEG